MKQRKKSGYESPDFFEKLERKKVLNRRKPEFMGRVPMTDHEDELVETKVDVPSENEEPPAFGGVPIVKDYIERPEEESVSLDDDVPAECKKGN